MGYYKNKAIELEEQRLEYLYEKYYIEAALIQAEQKAEMDRLMYEEYLIEEQINEDKRTNRKKPED
mgnify:CR=1 FL=1|tara:strand:- start:4332 stop:4529 length:198 start_codon:yes stop_codon:yes gene_type:complete